MKIWKLHENNKFTFSVNCFSFQAPPKPHRELRNHSVALNSTLTMTCIERGNGRLDINWTKNGVDLGNRNNTYTVDYVTFDHAGVYGCTAVNWAGKARTLFWIDVIGKVSKY